MMALNNLQNKQSLAALLQGVSAELDVPDIQISDLSLDSRQVKQGDVFFALEGLNINGVRFIRDAITNGAAAILTASPVDELTQKEASAVNVPIILIPDLSGRMPGLAARFYSDPSKQLKLVGITGTDGKTSVCHFVAQALQHLNQPCGIIGTLGNGLYGHLSNAMHTTPDILTLNKLLSGLSAEAEYVAMEVSSHGIDQKRIEGLCFKTAVLTNLSRDHLDYHGSMESYKAAKHRLFITLGLQNVVVNADDAFGLELLQDTRVNAQVYAYGFNRQPLSHKHKWVMGQNLSLHHKGFRFDVVSGEKKGGIESSLLGRFNASNVLAVLATLLSLDVEFEHAVAAVQTLRGVSGRMQLYQSENMANVVIDYAHTPMALATVLQVLREHCVGDLYCVFGCGGDRDRGKRALMGKAAAELADYLIVTDDNPRQESPERIVNDIVAGLQGFQHYRVEHDRQKAIEGAIRSAGADDIVLVAGKGHEDYQIIGTEKRFFSDQVIVKQVLQVE